MGELISVLLPVYNGDEYLSDSIESILNQSMVNFEFIIINDGSTDESLQIIRKYADVDARIKLINRENKGLIYTLNEGIQNARGRFIARMDQDDLSMEHRLELQYNYMIEHKLDVCGGDYTVIDEQGCDRKSYNLFRTSDDILLCLASNTPFPHPSVMIRKDFLTSKDLSYGMNGYRQAEDLDLWLKMFNVGAKFGNVDSMILKYRILPTSMSRVNHKKMMIEVNKQFDKFMIENIKDFERVLELFFMEKEHSKDLQRTAVKAALRYALIKPDLNVIYKYFKRVRFYCFIMGCVSFLNLKFSKK